MNLFVVSDKKTNQVWVFTEHADALAWKRSRPEAHIKQVRLHGVSLDAEKKNA